MQDVCQQFVSQCQWFSNKHLSSNGNDNADLNGPLVEGGAEDRLTRGVTGHLTKATDPMLRFVQQISLYGAEILQMLSVQHTKRSADPPGVAGISCFVATTVETRPEKLFG